MAIINKTFLHFFDIHFLDEKGVKHIPKKIFYEAFFATRFSLLCSEKVYIPASSYFESPICKKIVDQYLEIVPYGIVWLIGKAHNYLEFFESKLFQYSNSPEHIAFYESALKSEINFPFYNRARSSTKDIISDWGKKLDFSEVPKVFADCHGLILPYDIEEKWNNVPEKLGDTAFIVKNVLPLLFNETVYNMSVVNNLHEIINKSYFNSYVRELDASVVTDLVILELNYSITNNKVDIPYSFLLSELKIRNKIDLVKNYSPEELFLFRETDEWKDIFNTSIIKKKRFTDDIYRMHGIDPSEISIANNHQNISIYAEEVKMGDIYSAGQVGAQGPNAHAEGMVFNQIWLKNKDDFNTEKLIGELSLLRSTLKNEAETAEQLSELGAVANAEIEMKKNNGSKALEWLSKTGKWPLGVAEKIGVSIASAAIKTSMGL